jgi:hypothetical protein
VRLGSIWKPEVGILSGCRGVRVELRRDVRRRKGSEIRQRFPVADSRAAVRRCRPSGRRHSGPEGAGFGPRGPRARRIGCCVVGRKVFDRAPLGGRLIGKLAAGSTNRFVSQSRSSREGDNAANGEDANPATHISLPGCSKGPVPRQWDRSQIGKSINTRFRTGISRLIICIGCRGRST